MDRLDERLIQDFFMLGIKVGRMYKRIHDVEHEFYASHSFMASPAAVDETGYRLGITPWQILVEQLVESEKATLKAIEVVRYQERCFNRYLDTLAANDRHILTAHYVSKEGHAPIELRQRTLDEIHEILQATSWRFGFEPEVREAGNAATKQGLKELLDMFEVTA